MGGKRTEETRRKDRERQAQRRRERRERGLCYTCGRVAVDAPGASCETCRGRHARRLRERREDPEVRERYNAYGRKKEQGQRLKRKLQVIDAYGGKCACCGETEPIFLSVDHINGDGAEHRRQIGGSAQLPRWLIQNGFPEGFQILCHNCNMAKHINGGVCPHQLKGAE